ncbi:MAG: sugar ABC transporter permease [Treponema sp.]|nr:sugar ABC transporter permease [Treponema sp.]
MNDIFVFFIFILPALGAILFSVEIPFIMSIGYSFTKWNGLDRVPEFIGLENYKELFSDDPVLRNSLVFTFKQAVFSVILINVIALLLALALGSNSRGKNALRAAFYIPNIISLIVIGYIWRFIFSRGFGSLYEIIKLPILMYSWLGDAKVAFVSVLVVSVWQALGFYMVIYIAGLQVIPHEFLEAAMIDGAGEVKRFFKITLPMLMPSITVAVFYSIANSLKTLDVVMSLTDGGPGTSTAPIAMDIYKTAFLYSRFGYGTAKSVILFLLILIVTFFQVKLFKRREVDL